MALVIHYLRVCVWVCECVSECSMCGTRNIIKLIANNMGKTTMTTTATKMAHTVNGVPVCVYQSIRLVFLVWWIWSSVSPGSSQTLAQSTYFRPSHRIPIFIIFFPSAWLWHRIEFATVRTFFLVSLESHSFKIVHWSRLVCAMQLH